MENEILVTRSSMPPMKEYVEEIQSIWGSHWLTNMGVKHNKFELMLKDYLGVTALSLFTNGHMALELAIQGMGLTGEIITTPFTFISTTHAIVRNGIKPVFCDINKNDYTMDVSKIESLITDKTTAIVPVHVYGNICNIEEIEKIAHKYKLKVIYDAAHTFGVRYKGQGIGSYGDASMFSFHASKVFNTIEGGAVCYTDEELGKNLYRLKNFGIKDEIEIDGIGANAKMNEFQAAMGICNLKYIENEIEKRGKVDRRYRENLNGIDGISLCHIREGVEANYSYFPVLFDKTLFGIGRDEIYNILKENKIFTRRYFYPLTSCAECYKGQFNPDETPVALSITNNILTLPMYADLSLEDVDRICKIILDSRN